LSRFTIAEGLRLAIARLRTHRYRVSPYGALFCIILQRGSPPCYRKASNPSLSGVALWGFVMYHLATRVFALLSQGFEPIAIGCRPMGLCFVSSCNEGLRHALARLRTHRYRVSPFGALFCIILQRGSPPCYRKASNPSLSGVALWGFVMYHLATRVSALLSQGFEHIAIGCRPIKELYGDGYLCSYCGYRLFH